MRFFPRSFKSFFGVEFLAELAGKGSALPALISGPLAVAGAVAGLYAVSAWRGGPPWPFLRTILALAAVAFLFRGAWLAFELARAIPDYQSVRFRELLLSAASIWIGFLHLAGLRQLPAAPSAKSQA